MLNDESGFSNSNKFIWTGGDRCCVGKGWLVWQDFLVGCQLFVSLLCRDWPLVGIQADSAPFPFPS